MIYTPMTNRAMTIAYNAHHGQVDKAGLPYIFYPIHLAEQMEDEISCTVSLLHGTAEDTDLTFEDLEIEFPTEVMDALRLLSHQDGVDYFDYVRAIKQNPVAVKVKLADLAHNSDQNRCVGSEIPSERPAWWHEKYTKARAILTDK